VAPGDANLTGRRVLITGAARGIGAALARRLHARGARVAVAGLEPELLEEVARSCDGPWRECDVSDRDAVEAAVETAVAELGGLDIVVANAGVAAQLPIVGGNPAVMERTIAVNVMGVYNTLRAAGPHVSHDRGYALAISSLAAALHIPLLGAYCASKAAVEALSGSLAAELRPSGARVGVAYFAELDTDMTSRGFGTQAAKRLLGRSTPTPPAKLEVGIDALERGIAPVAPHRRAVVGRRGAPDPHGGPARGRASARSPAPGGARGRSAGGRAAHHAAARRAGVTQPRLAPGGRSDVGPFAWGVSRVAGVAMRTRPPNLFLTLGRHPKLFRAWLRFAGRLMPRGRLPRRETELVILRVAHLASCEYELEHHRRLGRRAGLTEADIERVAAGPDADGWPERERALMRAVDELHSTRDLDDATWDELRAHVDDRDLIELLLLAGHYEMLATVINTLRIQPDAPAR
jgi:AhpD family alkylhydroperoxidase